MSALHPTRLVPISLLLLAACPTIVPYTDHGQLEGPDGQARDASSQDHLVPDLATASDIVATPDIVTNPDIVTAPDIVTTPDAPPGAQTSMLWGTAGELWDPAGRLGDFSYAGYRTGNVPLPDRSGNRIDVTTLGATPDDDLDDTDAFIEAIAQAQPGQAVYAPAGVYDLSDVLVIEKGDISIEGAGKGLAILHFHVHLGEVTQGRLPAPPSLPLDGETCPAIEPPPMIDSEEAWSFSGGLIWFQGEDPIDGTTLLTEVTQPATRGDRTLTLASTAGITPGMRIRLTETDPPRTSGDTGSLLRHLHGDLVDGGCEQTGRQLVDFRSRVSEVAGNAITLERVLPVDVRTLWRPRIHRISPSIEDVGIRGLTIRFPVTTYPGEFNELGYNGVMLRLVHNCWVDDVEVLNADSAFFMGWAHSCTLRGVTIDEARDGGSGHHSFNLGWSTDNLITGMDIKSSYIHDLSIEVTSAGNVFSSGGGPEIDLDHHRGAPCMNLFTDLVISPGTRAFRSGGGGFRGPHTARYSTLWNVRASDTITIPSCDFGPEMTFVGVQTTAPEATCSTRGWHLENIPPADLYPADIHAAQLARRLR